MNTYQVAFVATQHLRDRIDAYARRAGLSRAAAVRQLLGFALAQADSDRREDGRR